MSQLSIDQLPDLCLRKIFGFLKLRDLARCRSVSHLFNYYANKIPARELVVHAWNPYIPSRWYLSERPIESGSEISQRAFVSLQTSQLQLPKQLKFLYVHSFRSADLEFVNSCERLEHFEIGRCSVRDTLLIEWTFPNLRVLSMGVSDHLQLILKTPKLEVLRCRYLERIEFEHPETVKILECDECYDADTIVMAKLKNLEVFRFNVGYDALDHVPPAIWQHLKELNLRLDWTMLGIGTYRALCRSLTDLLSRPKNGEELKIYLNDVRLVRASQLEDFDFMRNQTFKFHLKNYKLLTAGRRFDETYINYNYLVNNVEELSSDFFEKFPSIQTVEVTGPFDHDQLTWFLENTSDLRELILSSASVPDFLNNFLNNNLPNITDRLTELKVTEPLPVEQALDLAAKLFQRIASFDKFESKAPWNETIAIRRDPSAKDRFELWFHAIKNEAATVTSHRTKRKWTNLVELCEKRKANFDPPARSSKRIKREN